MFPPRNWSQHSLALSIEEAGILVDLADSKWLPLFQSDGIPEQDEVKLAFSKGEAMAPRIPNIYMSVQMLYACVSFDL